MRVDPLAKLAAMPAGTVFFSADLAAECMHTTEGIKPALQKGVAQGYLLRIARGVYCKPRQSTAGIVLPPDQDSVIEAFVGHYSLDAVPMGLSAAWRLGLVEERPNPYLLAVNHGQYKIRFNGWEVQFLPGRSMPFHFQTELAALLLTALPAIGERNLTQQHAATLKGLLVRCPDREAFREDVHHLPVWIKQYLRRL